VRIAMIPTQGTTNFGKGWPGVGISESLRFAQDSSPQQIRTRMEYWSYFAFIYNKIELRIIWSTRIWLEQKRCELFVRWGNLRVLSVLKIHLLNRLGEPEWRYWVVFCPHIQSKVEFESFGVLVRLGPERDASFVR
jgi:hypothetical protein